MKTHKVRIVTRLRQAVTRETHGYDMGAEWHAEIIGTMGFAQVGRATTEWGAVDDLLARIKSELQIDIVARKEDTPNVWHGAMKCN